MKTHLTIRRGSIAPPCLMLVMSLFLSARAQADPIEEARGYVVEIERAAYALYDEARLQDREGHEVGERALRAFLDFARQARFLREELQRPPARLRDLQAEFDLLAELHRASVEHRGSLRTTRVVRENCAIIDRRMSDLDRLFRENNSRGPSGWRGEDLREIRQLAARMAQDAQALAAFTDALARRDPKIGEEVRKTARDVARNASDLRAVIENISGSSRSSRLEFRRLLSSFSQFSIHFGTLRKYDGGESLITQISRTMDRITRAYLAPAHGNPIEDAQNIAFIIDETAEIVFYLAKSETKDIGGKGRKEGFEAVEELLDRADELSDRIGKIKNIEQIGSERKAHEEFMKALSRARSRGRAFGEEIQTRLDFLGELEGELGRYFDNREFGRNER